MTQYFVYLLKCSDGTLYAGYTTDLEKRAAAHNGSRTGAKYTRARRPVELVYSETYRSKSDALKREWEIKQMRREEKLDLFLSKNQKALLPATNPVVQQS